MIRRQFLIAMAVVLLVLTSTITASAEPEPTPPPLGCNGKKNPRWSDDGTCASTSPQPTTTGASHSPSAPAGSATSARPSATQPPAAQPSAAQRPTTAPEEWAAESGKTVAKIGDEVARRAKSRDRMAGWREALTGPYAVTLAIGWFLLAVVMVVNIARASYGGSRAEQRELLHRVLPKFIMYGPLSVLLPGLAAYLLDLGQNLTDTALAASGNEFASLIQTLGSRFSRAPLRDGAAVVVGTATGWSALLFLIAAVLLIVTLVSWLLQDWVAPMSMYLLTLMIPIVLALATQPRQQQRLLRLLGAILGAMLTPFITRFMFWATLPLISSELGDTGTNLPLSMFKVIALLAVCTSAPLALWYVMPHLLEGAGAIGNGPGSMGGLTDAGRKPLDAGQQLSQQIRSASQTAVGSPATTQRATILAKLGAGGGSTGSAAALLSSTAPIATSDAAINQTTMVDSARSTAVQSVAASGGRAHGQDPASPAGKTSDPDSATTDESKDTDTSATESPTATSQPRSAPRQRPAGWGPPTPPREGL